MDSDTTGSRTVRREEVPSDGDADGPAAFSLADARTELLGRWADRAGGRRKLPADAGSVVFTLLAAAKEPDDASRRFIASWYLRTARDGLLERNFDPGERRELFSALVDEAWRLFLRSDVPSERALVLGTSVERRVVRTLPEFDDAVQRTVPSGAAGPAGAAGGVR